MTARMGYSRKIQKGEAEDMEFEKIEKIEYGNSRGQ